MKNKLKALLKHKKILIAVVCVALFLIAVNCSGDHSDTTGEGAVKLYKSVITEYTNLLTAKQNGEELPLAEGEESDVSAALKKIVESCADPSVMGYATRDINSDGIDELVLLSKNCDLYALFTLVEKKPVLLQAMDGKYAAITENGTLYYNEHIRDKSFFVISKRIVDGVLTGLEYGYTVSEDGQWQYYKEINGQRTDSNNQEYLELNNSVTSTFTNSTYITKTAGFRFIPAITDESPESDAPVLRLSTYDDVLAMYKTVVGLYADFSKDAWVQGIYDELYTFSDNDSYAAFHGVLYAGYINRPLPDQAHYAENGDASYGYAYRDLDADGTDELILLRDDQKILAVFTRDNGKAVLLTSATAERTILIDEGGLLHLQEYLDREARDSANYLCKISGKSLEKLVAIAEEMDPITLEHTAFYKFEGAKKIVIDKEEWAELYARCELSEGKVSFTFTGLFD